MLSIVKMDLDSDPILAEDLIKSEQIDFVEEPIKNRGGINTVAHSLELIPIVYTTRLDDMTVLNSYSYPNNMSPTEATNRIIEESKPVLRILQINSKRKRRNKKRFAAMKAILQEIYCPSMKTNNNNKTDMNADECNIQIDLSSVKSEVQYEPSFEKTEPKDKCKYSELLKLCKPCSVMIGIPCDKVIHGGQVLHANRVKKPRLSTLSPGQSTDDEDLLITFPNLLVDRNIFKIPKNNSSKEKKGNNSSVVVSIEKKLKIYTEPAEFINRTGVKVSDLSHITQRLMRNGLLAIHDIFSKERHIYYTDDESNLLDYFKGADDSDDLRIHKTTNSQIACNYIAENCCWVKRDAALKSLYPKVLTYPNSRFMRRPHPCKPGACICCCHRKEYIKKPNLLFTEKGLPTVSANETGLNADDTEIIDLEDKIDKSIINITRTPKLDSTEWLRDLLTERVTINKCKTNSLIAKALSYNKPLPKKMPENRRLVTYQKGESQNTVIILRNFAMDVTEIYAINVNGDIETYIKTTCYNNTSQPDVRKLLKKPNAINESVCCWFKREEVITKLYNAKELHPSVVKFIRTNHTCPSTECTCCCKPTTKKEATLTNIHLRVQKRWTTALKSFRPSYEAECQPVEQPKLAPPKTTQSVSIQHIRNKPPTLVSVLPSNSSTSQSEDDCEITSITTMPTFQIPLQNSTVPVAVPIIPVVVPTIPLAPQGLIVTNVINSDELSQEVNSLITSILDRFKDVRLTINDDGKVAAALNTPINTLSTVELKVLANILSYAQNQVNVLGLKGNSGLSLSNIINLKVDDQANSNLDPQSVYKAFGKNVNLNASAQNGSPFMQAPESLTSVPQTYTYFTNATSVRNQHLNDAFSSYINSKIVSNPATESFAPVIENVFSIKEEADPESSSTTVWYRKPAAQHTSVFNSLENTIHTNSNSDTSNDNKRKDIETHTTKPKKLRVLSPAKLSTTTSNPEGIATASVENLVPGVGFVSNSHIQVPSTSSSQPILIINPLNTPSPSLMVRGGGTVSVSVPFTNDLIDASNDPNIPNTPMPIIVDSSTISEFVNTDGPDNSIEQGVNIVQTAVAVEDNLEEELREAYEEFSINNDAEVDNEINEAEIEYCVDNEKEEKYCPDNEEEEDCILGF